MAKTTLLSPSLIEMARFSKIVATGYLMNTNKNTLTGQFTEQDIQLAVKMYKAAVIETTEKIFTY
jgi:hypothetical protein